MAMVVESIPPHEEMDAAAPSSNDVLEEIDEDQTSITYGRSLEVSLSPEKASTNSHQMEPPLSPESPVKIRREFGNISPISELLDDEDIDVASLEKDEEDDSGSNDSDGKITPEPVNHPHRTSFPRISDGRSSPILAYSPSLIKSPSSSGSKSKISSSSSASGNGGGVGKRPRNIARMLDNISDHSSGEEEVNNVGILMAKFTV